MAFVGRELATTQSVVWSVIGGFTRDVVSFQESGISGKLKSNAENHCRRCLEVENGLSVNFAERGYN